MLQASAQQTESQQLQIQQPTPQSNIAGGQVAEEIIDGYTVTHLRAGGWTEEQIEWKRQSLAHSVNPVPIESTTETATSEVQGTTSTDSGSEDLGDAFAALGG